MSSIPPHPSDPTAARYPFDDASLAAARSARSSRSLPDRLRLHLHTLSFLSPTSFALLAITFLSLLHLSFLLLFTRGFLLSREELRVDNDCVPMSPDGILDASCSLYPTHKKAVILIIDALRSDFIFPQSTSSPHYSHYYHNHIPLPSHLTSKSPTHSFLSHFIADPPTTTLQRIKGLTTGSLPTFIDLGSNFAGEEIGEDNWLKGAKREGKRVAFMGDDTWLKVFPALNGNGSVWKQGATHPYDSFNVEDLDTVDQGVRHHLLSYLSPSTANEWDILLAHSLGLDHSGHRYGPSHAETTRKLIETEHLLEEVVERLDDDTLLVVMGDHGMTKEGDHGGDSTAEVDSVIWFYSKSLPLLHASWFSDKNPLISLYTNTESPFYASSEGGALERSVDQVDLVPTLSLLLGLPIPFGNLGVVIPELFWRDSRLPKIEKGGDGKKVVQKKKKGGKKSLFGREEEVEVEMEKLTPLETLLQATLLTSSQLSKYLNYYSTLSNDFKPHLPELTFILSLAKSHYLSSFVPGNDKLAMELKALEKYTLFSRKTREKAREFWAKFDLGRIAMGVTMGVVGVAMGVKTVTATRNGNRARFVLGRGVEGGLLSFIWLLSAWLLGAMEVKAFQALRDPIVLFGLVMAGASINMLLHERSPKARYGTFRIGPYTNWKTLVPLIPLLGHSLFFTSNSFIVFEDTTILFIVETLLIISFIKALSAPEKRLRNRLMGFSVVAMGLVKLMSMSTVCREEQGQDCLATFSVVAGSTKGLILVLVAMLFAWFLPTVLRASLSLSASDTALAPAYLGYGIRTFFLVGSGYWGVEWVIAGLDLDDSGKHLATLVKTGLARIVLVGAPLTSSLVWYYSPLCLRVQRETMRNVDGSERTQIKFIGFANTFGSSYLLFFSTVFALLWLVNPPQGQIVLGLHLVVLLCLLEIFDTERDVKFLKDTFSTASIEQLLNNEVPKPPSHTGPSFVQISLLAALAHLSFFATGHQAALSTINWSTAFIGFQKVVYPFSPLLVILNTLSPFILTSLSIPLFVFWNLSPTLRDQPSLPLIRNLLKALASYMTYQAVVALSAAFWASHFKRHLMVWKVFAPRYMTGAIELLATDFFALVAVGVALVTIAKTKATLGTKVAE